MVTVSPDRYSLEVGLSFEKIGDLERAIIVYKKGRENNETNPYAYHNKLAIIYNKLGKTSDMVNIYLELLDQSERYLSAVQNGFSNSIDFDIQLKEKEILRKALIKKVQEFPAHAQVHAKEVSERGRGANQNAAGDYHDKLLERRERGIRGSQGLSHHPRRRDVQKVRRRAHSRRRLAAAWARGVARPGNTAVSRRQCGSRVCAREERFCLEIGGLRDNTSRAYGKEERHSPIGRISDELP